MNKNEIHISKKAQKDLEQIYDYTVKNWSLKQADIYYDDFEEVLNRILKNPEIGRNYSEVNVKYFGVLVNNHIIFYKSLPHNCIKIIRVLHQKMDLSIKF